MAPGDRDYFSLGTVEAGETMLFDLRLPHTSTLQPSLEIHDADDNVVYSSSNPTAGVGHFDVTETGAYYAVVTAAGGEGPLGQYLLDAAVSSTGAVGLRRPRPERRRAARFCQPAAS